MEASNSKGGRRTRVGSPVNFTLPLRICAPFQIEFVESTESVRDVDLDGRSIDWFAVGSIDGKLQRAGPQGAVDRGNVLLRGLGFGLGGAGPAEHGCQQENAQGVMFDGSFG